MYVLAPNQVIEKYPYTIGQLRKDNPQTSFPKIPSDEMLVNWNVFRVEDLGQPAHDKMTQTVDELPPVFVVANNRWERSWAVRSATPEEISARQENVQREVVNATQNRLDAFAQTRGYDNILSACTYASSSVPTFATEGQYCATQRDATWTALLGILNDVKDGLRPIPSGYADIEAELPPLVWPN